MKIPGAMRSKHFSVFYKKINWENFKSRSKPRVEQKDRSYSSVCIGLFDFKLKKSIGFPLLKR